MRKKIKAFLKQILPPPVKTFNREVERILSAVREQGKNLLAGLEQLRGGQKELIGQLQADQAALRAELDAIRAGQAELTAALAQQLRATQEEMAVGLTQQLRTTQEEMAVGLTQQLRATQEEMAVGLTQQLRATQEEMAVGLTQQLRATQEEMAVGLTQQLRTTQEELTSGLMQKLSCAQEESLAQLDLLQKDLYKEMKEREERLRRKDPFENPPQLPETSQRENRDWIDEQDAEIPEGFERVIPVVFAANDNYAAYAGVAIESILKNAGDKNFYRIYILHSGLSRYHMETLELTWSNQASVQCVDVSKQINGKETELYERAYFTKEMYYRFLIAELFHFYDFVIYLDCDLVVCTDVADIIPEDMDDALVAGVLNPSSAENARIRKEKLGINAEEYINTGVLVFNLQQWKKENVTATCFRVLSEAPKEYLWCPDQDVLNIVCAGRIFFLESNWNFMWHMVYGSPEYVKICAPITARVGNAFKILHFASEMKPWEIPQVALSSCFWKYARMSCFYEEILSGKFL